jgi:flagellar motor switch protein FliM
MTPGAFDFRKPPPGELERQMGKWLTLTTRQATGVWARLIPYPTELKPGSVAGVSAAHGVGQLTDDTVGLPLTTTDSSDGTLLLAIHRPVLLGLLAGLLGETPTLLPSDRDLTDLEASLVDYLMRELFLNPLEKGWPGADPPALAAGNPGSPRSAWRMPGGDAVLLATILISTPFGEHPVHLLVPKVGRWERMANIDPRSKPVPPGPREHLEALVREMSVDLAVVLGTADVTMHDLTQLKAGDVVVLRQKVNQPLDGLISGTRKFTVWPGVVGTRAAVLIDAPAED